MPDTRTPLDAPALLTQLAPSYADVVLDNLARPYPHSAHHTARSADDRPTPEQIHPAFYTAFDWHSSVHMHVLGVQLLEHGVDAERDAALRRAIGANLTADKLHVEGAYLLANANWERPYGWAWLVRLAATCAASTDAEIRGWASALDPIVDVVAELFVAWVGTAEWPVRHGLHTNSAFGLGLMLDAFRDLGRSDAATACESAARTWFEADAGWPGDWEMSGQDFLSAGLSEADLLRRVLTPEAFATWFAAFLPGLTAGSRILRPYRVTDEADGYLVHLHGLNLSRAGQVARILDALRRAPAALDAPAAPVVAGLTAAREPLLRAGLEAVVAEDFMSSHWLATFAWDALLSASALADPAAN
ncbi:DUF2891 family protein [Cryobacterium sp. PH29-G1]|uniref:DUF2891 family protein n=1 Tax=Cryobacterium sp. PH29-G1 TaxID=3046211 RepID=UPI0024BA0936|nr:DUF2891 family protein [Cryobacterium sp. PH29-G1]MDJ0351018.1 DUF2891 family protein [Cryobacterium sp. PH29-G1]